MKQHCTKVDKRSQVGVGEFPYDQSMLEEIKQYLPRGYARIIERKTGYSLDTIYSVMMNRRRNDEIVRLAKRLAINHKDTIIKSLKLKIKLHENSTDCD